MNFCYKPFPFYWNDSLKKFISKSHLFGNSLKILVYFTDNNSLFINSENSEDNFSCTA